MAVNRPDAKLVLPALVLWALSVSAAGDVIRQEWDATPGADYYEGVLSNNHGPSHVRTTSTWLLLPSDSKVDIGAFDASGKRLKSVEKVKLVPFDDVAPIAAETTPTQGQELDPFGEDFTDNAYGDTETPYADDDESPAVTDLDAPAAAVRAPRSPLAVNVGVTLGVGKEWLDAHGGVSEYKGSANVGGTSVRGEARGGADGAWFGALQVSAHNFSTTIKRQDEASGANSQDESKFLRLSARGVVFYDLHAPVGGTTPTYTLGLGAGLGYYRLPVLSLHDDSTGTAELALKATMGPMLAVQYARHLTAAHTFGAEIAVLPMSFSKDVKGMSANALLFWRQAFVERLFTELAVVSVRESITVPVTCPPVDNCDDSSLAASRVLSARMGLGLSF